MNKRIRKLAEQAQQYASYNRPGSFVKYDSEWFAFYNKKFAELIVQRTLAIVEAHTEIFQSDQARAMVEHIKHSVKTDLGVEE